MEHEQITTFPMQPIENEFAATYYYQPGDKVGDSQTCVCGNTASSSGFAYCSRDGSYVVWEVEADDDKIDYTTIFCPDCYRVIDMTLASGKGHEWTDAEKENFPYDPTDKYSTPDMPPVPTKVIGYVGSPHLPLTPGTRTDMEVRKMHLLASALVGIGFDPRWVQQSLSTGPAIYIEDFFSDGFAIDINTSNSNEGEFEAGKVKYTTVDENDQDLGAYNAVWEDTSPDAFKRGYEVDNTIKYQSVYDIANFVRLAKHYDGIRFDIPTDFSAIETILDNPARTT